jgi:ABC-2 type transport system ATP-binding protein
MIHVENLTKYYHDLCAVDHINFDIKKGEIVGFLGPNGAGKTTTMRMLTGYIRPSSGAIRIKEYGIEKNFLEIKRLLGYLPESAPLYHEMLTYECLSYVAGIKGLDGKKITARIMELADMCGIREVMHKPVGELSKGYKQRVGLANAMINDPEILVLDEPTSGLDPNQIVEIRDIIKHIGREKTVMLSTHILSEAEATCDRVIIIDQGKIAADAEIATLKKSADGECSVNIILKNASVDEFKNELKPFEWITDIRPDVQEDDLLRAKIICRASRDVREDLYKIIKNKDWILLEFNQEVQSLEKIFMELTREN